MMTVSMLLLVGIFIVVAAITAVLVFLLSRKK